MERCSLLQQKKGLQPKDPDLRSKRRWESRRKRQVRKIVGGPGALAARRTQAKCSFALDLGTLTAFGVNKSLARLSFFPTFGIADIVRSQLLQTAPHLVPAGIFVGLC